MGAAFLLWDDQTCYSVRLVLSEAGVTLNAGPALYWNCLQWGANKGLSSFDFLGSDQQRIAHQWREMGAVAQPYLEARKISNRWLRLWRAWKGA